MFSKKDKEKKPEKTDSPEEDKDYKENDDIALQEKPVDKKKKDKKKGRVDKQYSHSRPVVLPPEHIDEQSTAQQEIEPKTENNDQKVDDNGTKTDRNTTNNAVKDEKTSEVKQSSPNNTTALQGGHSTENHEKKTPTMPSMQYRFSNKSYSKNQEEITKKKNLQAELDEILKKAAEDPAMPRQRSNYAPNNMRYDQDFVDFARARQGQSRNYPFINQNDPTPSPYAQRMSFSPNSNMTNNLYQSNMGQNAYQTNMSQGPYQTRTPLPQNLNNSSSIPIKDFDLNKLPDNIKKQIITDYLLKNPPKN